jgi:hypothetical protein
MARTNRFHWYIWPYILTSVGNYLDPVMNSRLLQPSVLLPSSLTERVVSGVGKALRAARVLRVLWRGSRARRRARRTLSMPSRI